MHTDTTSPTAQNTTGAGPDRPVADIIRAMPEITLRLEQHIDCRYSLGCEHDLEVTALLETRIGLDEHLRTTVGRPQAVVLRWREHDGDELAIKTIRVPVAHLTDLAGLLNAARTQADAWTFGDLDEDGQPI